MSGTQYDDSAAFHENGPYAHLITERRTAGRVPISMFCMALPKGLYCDPPYSYMSLSLLLSAEGSANRDFGTGYIRHHYCRGDFDLISPGVATEIQADGWQEMITFAFPFDSVKDVVSESLPNFNGDFGHLHAKPFREPLIERLCLRLWDESIKGNPYGELFAEGAILTIIAELMRLADIRKKGTNSKNNSLSSECLSQLVDYFEAHLDEKLSLVDLAALVSMPVTKFARAFKATTGQTPHQYFLERRISSAQALLASDDLPLSEVAYACGFASQSHMTDVFRAKLGVTPGRYRQEARL